MSKKDIEKKVRKIVRKLFEELKVFKDEGIHCKHAEIGNFDLVVFKETNENLYYIHRIWLISKKCDDPIYKNIISQGNNPKQEKRLAIEEITKYIYKEVK